MIPLQWYFTASISAKYCQMLLNDLLNRCVLSRRLNTVMLSAMRTSWGSSRPFDRQPRRLRSPYCVRVRGTRSWPAPAERSELREATDATGLQKSATHLGASPRSALYVSRQSLWETRSVLRSQCSSSRSNGVAWSNLFPAYATSAAAQHRVPAEACRASPAENLLAVRCSCPLVKPQSRLRVALQHLLVGDDDGQLVLRYNIRTLDGPDSSFNFDRFTRED